MPHTPAPDLRLRWLQALLALACAWAMPVGAAPAQPWPDLASPTAASAWPRIFYTPQQRVGMEEARKRPASAADAPASASAPLPPPLYNLDGLAHGRKNATAWINGQMLQQGESYAGRTVHIEPGLVRLRQAGQSDIVLRPGQQVAEDGAVQQDVLPAGSFRKK